MRFTIARERLLGALGAIGPATAKRDAVPILTHCLLEADGGVVRISGADFERRIVVEVPADVEASGRVAVPAQKLTQIIGKSPHAPVKVGLKGKRVLVECGGSHFSLAHMPTSEFPALPKVSGGEWRVPTNALATLVASVAFAAARENETVLVGVALELRPGRVRMVATNRHHLAKMELPSSGSGAPLDLVVPPWALEQASSLFAGDEDVALSSDGTTLALKSPTATLFTRLVGGKYPDYEQIIPRENTNTAHIARAPFIAAVERMNIIASGDGHRVDLSFNAGMVRLSAAADTGEAADECAVRYTGDPMEIAFDARLLLAILRHLPSDEIKVALSEPHHAATLEPVGVEAGTYLCLLMPLRR